MCIQTRSLVKDTQQWFTMAWVTAREVKETMKEYKF